MTDEEIEALILGEIRKKGITYYDMKSLPSHGIDEDPEDKTTTPSQKRIRSNRFTTCFGSERMKELLCKDEYSPYNEVVTLKVPLQDLFRFWWNKCVVQEYVVDDVLEEVFEYFTSLMAPAEKKEDETGIEIDFDRLPLFAPAEKAAA